jgi:hypothetical protein
MQFLHRWIPRLLVVGAVGVVIATLFSDHRKEYGSVTLPQGGVVTLPDGKVEVFLEDSPQQSSGGDPRKLTAPLRFDVTPVGGGALVSKEAIGLASTGEEQTERSQSIGSKDAVVKLDVPAAGEYRVSGSYGDSVGSSLDFGISPFQAVLDDWKLWAGMLAGALLIWLVPKPRRQGGEAWEEDAGEASYQPSSYSPYSG